MLSTSATFVEDYHGVGKRRGHTDQQHKDWQADVSAFQWSVINGMHNFKSWVAAPGLGASGCIRPTRHAPRGTIQGIYSKHID